MILPLCEGDNMDLKQFDTISAAEKGFTYAVLDFDEVETDIKIDVLGVGSRVFKQAKQKIDNREAMAAKRGKPIEEDESNELWIELLAKCTKGWQNVEEGGKKVEFSYDNAVDIYTKYPFIRNQVLAATHDLRKMIEGNS